MQGIHLVAEAPSGIGKTSAVLSGVLAAAIARRLRVLYLVRTHKQLDRVASELAKLSNKHPLKALIFRGRLSLCPYLDLPLLHQGPSSLDYCMALRATGKCSLYERFFDLEHLPRPGKVLDVQWLLEFSQRASVCPYEVLRAYLHSSEIVVANYLHLFSELKETFLERMGTPLGKLILVIDEAHNLPETLREAYSLELSEEEARWCHEELKKIPPPRMLSNFLEQFIDLKRWQFPRMVIDPLHETARSGILKSIEGMISQITSMRLALGLPPTTPLVKLLLLAKLVVLLPKGSWSLLIKSSNGKRVLKFLLLDVRAFSREIFHCIASSISISGTLSPLEVYAELLGISNRRRFLHVPSPYSPSQLLVLTCKAVTTRYPKRTTGNYRKMVLKISEISRAVPLNIGVFCASYEVLQGLLDAGLQHALEKPLFIENPKSGRGELDEAIEGFKRCADRGGAVLLGVLGGRFSEGADFPGKEMGVSVIVGVPYAKPSPELEELEAFYSSLLGGRGRAFAYLLPAVRRAAQAAGRTIRSLHDRGAIVLMDYRYASPRCRRLLPSWISSRMRVVEDAPGVLAKELSFFFGVPPS